MNFFSITSLFIFISSICFALFLYSGNQKSTVTRAWFLVSGSIAFWGLSLYGVTSAEVEAHALLWQYALDVSAIFIPVLYFNFVSEFLRVENKDFRNVSVILAFILAFFSFSGLFKTGVAIRYGIYWIVPGSGYILFPIFFILYTIFSLYLMVQAYHRNQGDTLYRAQIRNTFIAGLIGFSGGLTNFFPQVFDIYPFGNYFVILYIFFMTYGVLRYKLLSTRIVAAQFFSGALVLVFLFNLLIRPESLTDWLIKFILFVLVLFFSILLVRGVYKEVQQRQHIESLAKELEKANALLESANDRLKELDKLKSEFVSMATHQIRGPITAIKGYTSMILEGDYGPVPPPVKETVKTILESSSSLDGIVQDFLDISRIEQGRMKYEFSDVDISKLVADVLTELKPNIEAKNLSLTLAIESGITIRADKGKLQQVIENIVDNSLKYTPKGGLTVRVQHTDKTVRIAVTDTGVGIKPEALPKLFQKFSRAEDASKANLLGTGLGLYVARQLIEAQGGTIRAESEGEGKGATFTVELKSV